MYHYEGGPDGSLSAKGFLTDISGDTIDIGDCSIPIITDWNSDGLLDLVLGTYGPHDESNALFYEWRVYLNVGTAEKYQFDSWETIVDSKGDAILASTLVIKDLDRDGKKDLIFSYKHQIPFAWYRDVGTAQEPKFTTYQELTIPEGGPIDFSFYDLADITGDGVLDLLFVDMYYPKYSKGVVETNATKQVSETSKMEIFYTVQKGALQIWSNTDCENRSTSITLYDIQGRVIRSVSLREGVITIDELPSGWYGMEVNQSGITKTTSLYMN